MPIGGAKIQPPVDSAMEEEDKPLPRGAYNLDALGDDAFGGPPPGGAPPKKNPPARFAKAAKDEEMKDESDSLPEKKPVPKKIAEEVKKPAQAKAAAAKPGVAAAKGAQVQDEDTGAGLSKEEAEAKVRENFPGESVEKLDSTAWAEKVAGFKEIAAHIIELNPSSDVIEGIVRYTKMKLKDWKESNVNIVKEAIALFTTIAQNCENLQKRSVYVMMPFLSDKLGDVKTLAVVSELLLLLSEVVTPKYVALQIVKYGSAAKSPKIIQESCTVLVRMTDDFGGMTMPLKEMIDFGITAANNSNAGVRTQAMALFATMYKHVGDAIKNLLKDIKESTMKLIEDEFAKVTPFKKGEFQRKRNFKGEAAFEEKSAAGPGGKGGAAGGGLDDIFPRVDISKLLTPKLMPLMKDNDWKKRKEAADKVEEILKGAGMRIQPVGLNELMDGIKQRMSDANKAVLKAYVQLIASVVEALGANAKQLSKKILPPMLQSLSDKQSLVRADVVAAMNKWADNCGAELIIAIGGPMISQDNPELRTEMLQWIIKNKDSIKLCPADALKEITKPLVECLSDKTPAIRNLTEEVICSVMPLTGYPGFQSVLSNLKPAVQNTIKPILERIKTKVGALAPPPQAAAQAEVQPVQQEKKAAGPTLKQPAQPAGPTLKPKIQPKEPAPQANLQSSISDASLNQSIGLNSSQIKKKDPQGGQTPQRGTLASAMKKESTQQVAAPTGPRLKQPVNAPGVSTFNPAQTVTEPPVSDILQVNFGFKEKRALIDMKQRFIVEEIKSDQVEKLKMSTTTALGSAFCQKMFSQDFKLHCECIDAFNNLMQNQPDAIIQILDLIFKWSCVRLADSSNTKFAVNMFDFYASLFNFLMESEYQLQEFEAAIIIPLLCEKTGISNNLLKEKVRKLLRMTFDIYDIQKTYNLIVTYGFNSKNLNAQAECLDEIAEFISRNGIDHSSEKEMKLVAKMADHNSKNNRENALKLLGEAYKHIEDNIWRVIGDVTPKVQGLLEARFKKIKGVPVGLTPSASTTTLKPPGQNHQLSSSYGFKQNAAANQNQMRKSLVGFQAQGAQIATARNTIAASPQVNQIQQGKPIMQMQQQINNPAQVVNMPQKLPQQQQNAYYGAQKAVDIYPNMPAQTLLQDEDEDEDLRIFTNDDFNYGNSAQDKLYEEIMRHIHQLKYADLSKRVDSLVWLNDQINNLNDTNQPVLVKVANDLIGAYVSVMIEIFDMPSADAINLRFAKYFIQIVLKTCSCKEIMSQVHKDQLFQLAEQLLTRLLIEGLDKCGENKEGEMILKNLNSSMLRILENCNHTSIICVLIDLQRKYRDYPQLPKMPNLIVKCILKLSKIIEKLIDQLEIDKILLSMHEYILVINHDNKTPNDENGIKVIKTIMNEFVKLKRESIYDSYTVIKCHSVPDVHIYKWIDIILRSLRTQSAATVSQPSTGTQSIKYGNPSMIDMEIRQIVEDLKNSEKFEKTLPRLVEILEENPQIDLDAYLSSCSLTFQKFVKNNLQGYRQNNLQHTITQPVADHSRLPGQGHMVGMSSSYNYPQIGGAGFGTQRQTMVMPQRTFNNQGEEPTIGGGAAVPMTDRMSKLQNMKERMSLMKSGAGAFASRPQGATPMGANANNGEHTAPASSHNMNTSFSAMNSSLSAMWMNKKQQIAGTRDTVTALPSQQIGITMAVAHQPQNECAEPYRQPQAQLGHSLGLNAQNGESQQAMPPQQISSSIGGTVQNADLNSRLAEMKAKLQALKKQDK